MIKNVRRIEALVPVLLNKLRIYRQCAYRVAAVAFSKKGNMLGIEMNGHRMDIRSSHRGAGKHAEAALIKKFGRRIDCIYILRSGNSGDILPIHPCESCSSMANKLGIKIIPIHEFLGLY